MYSETAMSDRQQNDNSKSKVAKPKEYCNDIVHVTDIDFIRIIWNHIPVWFDTEPF